MLNRKRTFAIVILLMAIVAALFAFAVVLHAVILGGAMSILSSVFSGAVILTAYIKSNRSGVSTILLLLAAACFSWTAGDVIVAVLLFQGQAAYHNTWVSVAFFIPNIMFAATVILFGYYKFSTWRTARGIVEALTIGTLSVIFIWLVFFGKDMSAVRLMASDGFISIASIIIDIFIIIEFSIIFFSESKAELPGYIVLFAAGLFLFSLNDIIYYVTVYKNVYVPNNFSDLLYSVALLLTASGGLMLMLKGSVGYVMKKPEGDNGSSKWLYLLVFPVVSAAVGSAEAVDLMTYAIIIGLYHASVKYIQLARENEELYQKQYNISETLEKRIEEQLEEMTVLANQDTITPLYNRRFFSKCMEDALGALEDGDKLAVLQFDVDRFKTINDSYGHDVGDKVIAAIADRLQKWNTHGAVLARLGGDEFGVMCCGCITHDELGAYCSQITEICSAPIYVDDQILYITISTGVTVCPDDACDAVTLMKKSDISMYKAKEEGFNKYVFYSPLFEEYITRKNEIEALLRKADLARDFELVFQPQFDLLEDRLIGAEALIRWNTAEHGYIPPSVFVPVAEEIDFISKIGKWVLIKAVEQVIQWNRTYGLELKMGVNISPRQLSEDDFSAALKNLIIDSGVNPAWIDAEITENMMIEENAKVKPIFDLFGELNISVSIDDFGSGYSSLGYLNKYQFNRIKIDKSLIDNLVSPGDSGVEVVKAIIRLAEAVGITTLAEGMESKEQLRILRKLGCRQVQGFILGKPVPAAVFAKKYIEKNTKADTQNVGRQKIQSAFT